MIIASIKKRTGLFRVHNITTKKNNNYYAQGLLVHNCFAYYMKSSNPGSSSTEVELKSIDVEGLIKAIQGKVKGGRGKLMYDHFYSRQFPIHWGGLADPFCSFERTNKVGLRLMEFLADEQYPTLFSFKGSTILDKPYQKLLAKAAKNKNFAFQVSIVTGDDELAKVTEIGVPSTTKRLEVIKNLSDMGYFTILRLRPYILGVSDVKIESLLERALEAGIKGISTEFMAIDGRSNDGMRARYAWLGKVMGVKNLTEYYSRMSPSERGGYMRLNRLVKEPHVRRLYDFCLKHDLVFGCSDPDFKELNTSGSCCAMPDVFKGSKLSNWTRSQLTYHLKVARQVYHKTGKTQYLTFSEVYGNETYLDEPEFTMDHISKVGMSSADRIGMSYRDLLRAKWNNLDSPANPRNYLHGKVLPCGLDDKGDLKFVYVEHEYEQRWKDSGIDMTR